TGTRILPLLLGLFAAVLWGLWWLPVRGLEAAGLTGLAAVTAMCLGALPALAPAALRRGGDWPRGRSGAGALFMGVAVILYGYGLTVNEVVRTILFFYLAPAWSIAIELLFFGRRWYWRSGLALVLSLSGLVVIQRGEIGLAAFGLGDLVALGAGLAWSIGSAMVFSAPSGTASRLTLIATASAFAGGVAVLSLTDGLPEISGRAAGLALLWGTIFTAPVLLATIWGALRLGPATLSFLLTAEIVTGVISSALLLDEPFGLPEALGAALIVLGGIVEVLLAGRAHLPDRPFR
ncbi:MAG: DMT family transporter, partial [Alphaproteobacteria bacterium]